MYIRGEELPKVFEWGSISKQHARRTVWPQVVFHTRAIFGVLRRLAALAGEQRLCSGFMMA